MPKAETHFDSEALLTAVQQQDVGLRVSTNNPAGFRRVLYKEMRAKPHLRCHIYVDPHAPLAFLLLKKPHASFTEEKELPHE